MCHMNHNGPKCTIMEVMEELIWERLSLMVKRTNAKYIFFVQLEDGNTSVDILRTVGIIYRLFCLESSLLPFIKVNYGLSVLK